MTRIILVNAVDEQFRHCILIHFQWGSGKGGEGKEETVKECIIPTQLSITLSQHSAVIAIFHCDDLFCHFSVLCCIPFFL